MRRRLTESLASAVVVAALAVMPTHAFGAARHGGLLAGAPSIIVR